MRHPACWARWERWFAPFIWDLVQTLLAGGLLYLAALVTLVRAREPGRECAAGGSRASWRYTENRRLNGCLDGCLALGRPSIDAANGLDPDLLIRAFRLMHLSRRLDDREIALKRQNRIYLPDQRRGP